MADVAGATTDVVNLVYISGSGRSGSTMLERILHSSPDMFALGEFHGLWRLRPEEITCSCGKPFESDAFWRKIRQATGFGPVERRELKRLEDTVSRSGFIARHRFDLRRLAEEKSVQRFLALNFGLFEGIACLSGARYIIDSSKAGPRCWLMACDPRTRVLHLYRRPQDVIASWRSAKFDRGLAGNMKRMSVASAGMDWWKVEQLARLLTAEIVARIDYAALCANPRAEIDAALRKIGLGAVRPPDWIDSHSVQPDQVYHSLNGNPDRFDSGPMAIAHRQVDWTRHAAGERAVIRAAGGLLGLLYPSPPSRA